MSYSNFTLEEVKQKFALQTIEKIDIFTDADTLNSSEILQTILQDNLPIAIASNSEKARSEMIIAPILVELKRHFGDEINLSALRARQKAGGRGQEGKFSELK